jgi:glc operon protein GlcG
MEKAMFSINTFIITLCFLAMGSTGYAQVMQKNTLTLDGAKKVIAAAMAEAKAKNAPGAVIAVVDDGGNLMALERIDGTFAAGAHVSMGKARTAVQFKRPTRFFEEIINKGRTAMAALPDFTPLIGGVPIEVDGKIVGGVGVSGAASAQQDEELAIAGANALKSSGTKTGGNPSSSPPAEVIYIPAAKVNEAFAKGAVLVGKEERMMHTSRNYMVHASRRDAPGMAEIHELDTDIIYVLEGTATLVTGGVAVDAKPIAEPNEMRGASIKDGESRRLVKGDVIIIPNGAPHWFKEVKVPFQYFVVKVR